MELGGGGSPVAQEDAPALAGTFQSSQFMPEKGGSAVQRENSLDDLIV